MILTGIITSLCRQWFIVAIVVAIVLASTIPEVGAPGGVLHTETTLHVAVAASFLISGLTLPSEQLVRAMSRLRLHAFIQGFNLVIIPLLALALAGLANLCGLPPVLATGLIALGCMPTTIVSAAVLTRSAGGNEAAAVFNTTLGNLLGIVVSPLMLMLFLGVHGEVPMVAVLTQLGQEVVVPLLVGQVLHLLLKRHWLAPSWFGQLASLCVIYIVFSVFCGAFANREFSHGGVYPLLVVIAVAILHGAALMLAWWMSGWRRLEFTQGDRIAVLYCATQKTLSLGVPMLAIIWRDHPQLAALTLPLIAHHLLQIAVGSMLVPWIRSGRA